MSQVKDKPTYWRSLAELENDPEFQEAVQREFPFPLDQSPKSGERRRFMQVMGASFALAGLTSGCRWKEDKLIDFAKRPQGLIPGEARRYATAIEISGQATGLLATSYDGRPVKLEGNPHHPASLGAASLWHQANLLELYDPDRSQHPQQAGKKAEWAEVEKALREHAAKLRAQGGKGLRVLMAHSSSPSLADLWQRIVAKHPQAKLVQWEPAVYDEERQGTKLAFGKPHRVHLDVAKAAVIVSLDADFISPSFPMGLANARAFAATRDPDGPRMSRLYVIESGYSHAGSMADHRLPLRSELVKAFAVALDAAVSAAAGAPAELGTAQAKPGAAFLADPKVAKLLDALSKDLVANRGTSLVVAGPQQPAEVHALSARINSVLGNVGLAVSYSEEADPDRPASLEALADLVKEMNGGQVDTLFVIGVNPHFSAPADSDFAAAHAKVKTTIAVTTYEDETAKASSWHVPLAHFLECWNDTVAWDGTLALAQPLIHPLYGAKSPGEVLALLVEDAAVESRELVRRTHQATYADERKWKRLVHDGVAAGSLLEKKAPKLVPLAPIPLSARELAGVEVGNGQLELVLAPCSKIYDGRWANNAWLQELPESFSKLSWGNAALMAPATAAPPRHRRFQFASRRTPGSRPASQAAHTRRG